jgi:hypothetical protein
MEFAGNGIPAKIVRKGIAAGAQYVQLGSPLRDE